MADFQAIIAKLSFAGFMLYVWDCRGYTPRLKIFLVDSQTALKEVCGMDHIPTTEEFVKHVEYWYVVEKVTTLNGEVLFENTLENVHRWTK